MCVCVFLLFLFKDPVHNRFTDKKYIGNRTEKKYVGDTPSILRIKLLNGLQCHDFTDNMHLICFVIGHILRKL